MYRTPTTQNVSGLDYGLSRSLRVKRDGAIGLPIYGSLLMFNSNIWPELLCKIFVNALYMSIEYYSFIAISSLAFCHMSAERLVK